MPPAPRLAKIAWSSGDPDQSLGVIIKPFISRIKGNEFIRHNAIFFIGSFVVSAVNYLYYPILGRLLSTVQFGEVQALVSLFTQAGIFLSVVTNVVVNVVANERDDAVRNRVVYEMERLAGFFMLTVVGIALIFVRQLQDFLQFPEVAPFFALGVVLIAGAPLALRTAYLRGRSEFGRVSVANIINSVGKVVASALLVLIGLGTTGAIGGLVVAQLISLLYARAYARKLGLRAPAGKRLSLPDLTVIKPHLAYTGLVLVVSLMTTLVFSFDTLLVKHYFPAETAGFYAGIATIARIIYFLTGSFAIVLLSKVRRSNTDVENRNLLKKSLYLHLAIGGTALIGFGVLPGVVVHILIGAKYLPYAHLLPLLSVALFALATVNLLLNYDMALRRKSAAVVAIISGIVTLGFVMIRHDTLDQVVTSLLYGAIVTVAARFVFTAYRRLRPRASSPLPKA